MCYDQAEMYSNQQQKAEFLQSVMGKGILLLSLSMIKYSWYTVMKQVLSTFIHIIVYTALLEYRFRLSNSLCRLHTLAVLQLQLFGCESSPLSPNVRQSVRPCVRGQMQSKAYKGLIRPSKAHQES